MWESEKSYADSAFRLANEFARILTLTTLHCWA